MTDELDALRAKTLQLAAADGEKFALTWAQNFFLANVRARSGLRSVAEWRALGVAARHVFIREIKHPVLASGELHRDVGPPAETAFPVTQFIDEKVLLV